MGPHLFLHIFHSLNRAPHIGPSQRNMDFSGGLVVKNPPADAGDLKSVASVPESGRSPGEGHGKSLQYSYLENPMDRGAWRAMVHGVAKSQK